MINGCCSFSEAPGHCFALLDWPHDEVNTTVAAAHVVLIVCVAVYDVTRKETFESLGDIWMQEVVRAEHSQYSSAPPAQTVI